jgi:predicted Zn finger-like uncharacterized protein
MEQLATQCPHCGTQFRVTLAQLELRDGRVRCGSCREVFNGIDTVFEYTGEPSAAPSADNQATEPEDFSNRMTLFDVGTPSGTKNAGSESNMQEELDALSRAISDLQSKPWAPTPVNERTEFADEQPVSSATASNAPEQPGFVKEAREHARGNSGRRVWLWVGIPLLLLALIAQLSWMFRNEIAARSPQAGKLLRAACVRLHCEIKLPLNLEQLSLSSSRLEQAPPSESAPAAAGNGSEAALRMTLIALLQNTSDTAQTWPALELTLRDTDGTLLVRKVFLAHNYVTPNELREGMPARSEREIRLPLALTGEPPAGFAVSIFYP